MKFFNLFSIIFSIILIQNTFAQDPPIEWGEISIEDLKMQSFPADTNAAAIILCDYGESSFNHDLYLEYKRHLRVKILTTKGYEWGTHSVVLYTKDSMEDLDDLEAVTYTLDEDDDIIETEFDDDDLFEEKVDDERTRYRFTLPGLSPGCIIEIKYTIRTESLWFIKDWVFQHNEPTLWSEYRVRSPQTIAYSTVFSGFEQWYLNEKEEVTQIFNGAASAYLGNNMVRCNQYRWVVKDAPAIRDEPFITTTDDYVNKADVQLAGYVFVGVPKKDVLNSWNKFAEELSENEYLGERIDVTSDVEDLEKEITRGAVSAEEKMIAIYNWVASTIVWTGEHRVFSEMDVDEVLEIKKGNSSEVTALLLSLLKSAGINGNFVILSTRANGKLQDLYPILNQFNYVVAKVNIGSKIYFLDATDPLRPYDLIPSKILNVKGLVIQEGKPEWVTFTTDKKNNNTSLVQVSLKEDGSFTGVFEQLFSDYKGLETRKNAEDKKDQASIKELFKMDASGIEIDSIMLTDKDSINLPIKVKGWIHSESYAQTSGDMIYINPYLINSIKENPLKTSVRKFPIDYAHKSSNTTVINITIPENYEIKEGLTNKSIRIGNSLAYTRMVEVTENIIQIIGKFEIKETVIRNNLYDQLKDFYAQIVSAQSEQIVLQLKQQEQTNVNQNSGVN